MSLEHNNEGHMEKNWDTEALGGQVKMNLQINMYNVVHVQEKHAHKDTMQRT